MSLCNCDKCGRVFLTKWEKRCTSCSQLVLNDSNKVKDFVRTNPRATLIEIYHQTGVSLQTIKEINESLTASASKGAFENASYDYKRD